MSRKEKKHEEYITLEEHARIKTFLSEEIIRKDGIIEKLKQENEILLKTALKRSEALKEVQERLKKTSNYKTIDEIRKA